MLCLLLTLLVTPITYSIFDDLGAGKFFRRRKAAQRSLDAGKDPLEPATVGTH